jgi:8-oxo-dGTP diphosphatase
VAVENQGVDSKRYTLIPRVLVFAVNESGKVLLLQGAPEKKIWPNKWNGIGGHVEQGESVLQAAHRELLEESGLSAKHMQYCGQVVVDTDSKPGIIFFVFKAKLLEGTPRESEEGRLAWFRQKEALKLDLVEDLYTLIPIVMRQRPSAKPFWGLYSYDERGQLRMSFSTGLTPD